MSKWLKLELLTAACSIAAFLISRFDPSKALFWLGVVLGVGGAVGAILLKVAADNRKKEVCVTKRPRDWIEEKTEWQQTRLEIEAKEHGRGSNINVRWEFVEYDRFDLEPTVVNGNITLRYKRNNYPSRPKIPLRVYVSGR